MKANDDRMSVRQQSYKSAHLASLITQLQGDGLAGDMDIDAVMRLLAFQGSLVV